MVSVPFIGKSGNLFLISFFILWLSLLLFEAYYASVKMYGQVVQRE